MLLSNYETCDLLIIHSSPLNAKSLIAKQTKQANMGALQTYVVFLITNYRLPLLSISVQFYTLALRRTWLIYLLDSKPEACVALRFLAV